LKRRNNKLIDDRKIAEESAIKLKLENFSLLEQIHDLKDDISNMKEVQRYFEELVMQKSKEVNTLREELLSLK